MSRNQLDGKRFEGVIKAMVFPGSEDHSRTPTAKFDIEAKFDKARGLPTSIKSSKSNTIGLSDARAFFSLNQDFRMLIGRYEQSDQKKSFYSVHELILKPATLRNLRGDMSYETVKHFHDEISLKNFPSGEHVAARNRAKSLKSKLEGVKTDIILNPKIDSNTQRRLQCSVNLQNLIKVCENFGEYKLHSESIGNLPLPWQQISSPRKFN